MHLGATLPLLVFMISESVKRHNLPGHGEPERLMFASANYDSAGLEAQHICSDSTS